MHKLTKKIFQLATVILALKTSSLCADYVRDPDRVYAGFSGQSYNSLWANSDRQAGALTGLIAGYDHVVPDQVYWGLEGAYASGMLSGTAGSFYSFDYYAEGRFGYSFPLQKGRALITPFSGFGYHGFNQKLAGTVTFMSSFLYVPFGFIFEYIENEALKLGFSAMMGPMFNGRWKSTGDYQNARGAATCRFEAPMTYTASFMKGGLGVTLRPFAGQWQYLNTNSGLVGQKNIFWGFALEVGCSF